MIRPRLIRWRYGRGFWGFAFYVTESYPLLAISRTPQARVVMFETRWWRRQWYRQHTV